jgi:hypothetical protein
MLILFINIILFCKYILDNEYDDRRNIQFPFNNNLNFLCDTWYISPAYQDEDVDEGKIILT